MRIKPGMLLVARSESKRLVAFWGEYIIVTSLHVQSPEYDADDHDLRRRWCRCIGYSAPLSTPHVFNHHSEFLFSHYDVCNEGTS